MPITSNCNQRVATPSGFNQVGIVLRYLKLRTIRQKANLLLAICILVCSTIAASLSFFASSVQLALDGDIAKYLGAPLVLRSDTNIPTEVYSPFHAKWVETPVVTASFTTGAVTEGSYQSVSLKGVSHAYPLEGELLIRRFDADELVTASQLSQGSVWLDRRVLTELNVEIGDRVQIGQESLLITAVLVHEPDRLTQLQHALPRAMVSMETLFATGVGKSNGRGEYRVLLSGNDEGLLMVEQFVNANFAESVEVLKPGKGRHPFSRISLRAERLLNVIMVLILLMCGGAAASLASFTVRNYAMSATVLRCMGIKRNVVAWALCLQLVGLAVVVGIIGCLLGWISQPLLNQLLQPHMTLETVSLSVADLAMPVGVSVIAVVAFVVPRLQQLGAMPISIVLGGNIEVPKRAVLTVLLAAASMMLVIWYYSDNLQLTSMLVGGVFILVLLSVGFGWLLSKTSSQFHRLLRGPLKIAVRSIGRSSSRHIMPIVCVSIAVMAVMMTVMLRGSFLDQLQVQMLDSDGNYIFTGLPAKERALFSSTVTEMGATIKNIHPTVSARLITINDVDIDKALDKESETREETRSRVRLSWANSKPNNNRLLDGSWPSLGSNEVSVESEVMADLDLKLGDVLGFQIGDQVLQTRISSRREYSGGGSRMMFWFMFAQDALAPFEQKSMGGVLIRNRPQAVLSKISSDFPQVHMADLERQLSGIRGIMIALTRLMNTTLFLLFCGAFVVIVATSFVSSSSRTYQMQLMRALGLRRSYCYAINLVEHGVIGLVACVVGVIGVQLIANALFQSLFNMPYQLDWSRTVSLTAMISFTFVGIGGIFAYQELRRPTKLN